MQFKQNIKKKRHMVLIPMLIYAVAFFMIILFAKIFGYTGIQMM